MRAITLGLLACLMTAATAQEGTNTGGLDPGGLDPGGLIDKLDTYYKRSLDKHAATMQRLQKELAEAIGNDAREAAQAAIDLELRAFESGLKTVLSKLDGIDPDGAPKTVVVKAKPPAPGTNTGGLAAGEKPPEPPPIGDRIRSLKSRLAERFTGARQRHGRPAQPGSSDGAGRESAPGQVKDRAAEPPRADGKGHGREQQGQGPRRGADDQDDDDRDKKKGKKKG